MGTRESREDFELTLFWGLYLFRLEDNCRRPHSVCEEAV